MVDTGKLKSNLNVYVNDEFKFILCAIPKVASTNLLHIMVNLTHQEKESTSTINTPTESERKHLHYHDHIHIRKSKALAKLKDYSDDDIAEKIKTYRKVIFVRHPLERLHSAYLNKFVNYNPVFHEAYGSHIINMFRVNASGEANHRGHGVTFSEFIRYVTHPLSRQMALLNEHWETYDNLCQPCILNYDIVGQYSNFGQEVKWTLKELNIDHLASLPNKQLHYTRVKHDLADVYANISSLDIHRLWKFYRHDFSMFGYSYPDWIN